MPVDIEHVDTYATRHAQVMVVSPDCDLLWDFNARVRLAAPTATGEEDARQRRQAQSRLLEHLLACDVFEANQVRAFVAPGSDLWKRVCGNQDERFHHLPGGVTVPAAKGEPTASPELPELYLDFRRVWSLPVADLYQALNASTIARVVVVPPAWIYDLMHRLNCFLGRVALEE